MRSEVEVRSYLARLQDELALDVARYTAWDTEGKDDPEIERYPAKMQDKIRLAQERIGLLEWVLGDRGDSGAEAG